MKRLTSSSTALLFLSLALVSCGRSDRGNNAALVYRELEPNDGVFEANDFGVLRPGDLFYIDGFTSDLGFDPFDGFAFTAAEPIHVDFRLFHANARDDFDVCLYDPVLDETLACFATEFDPEVGGVDVTLGGTEFHLVVESFFGEGAYTLEIAVTRLFGREAEAGPALRGSAATPPLRTPRAVSGYRRGDSPAGVTTVTTYALDETTGAIVEEVRVERAGGE